jgi:hypothetical protein
MKVRLAALALLAAPIAACSSSNLIVEQAVRQPMRVNAVQLAYSDSTVNVDPDGIAYLQRKMTEAFHGGTAPAFREGQDLTIRYRFVSYEEGSRIGRYLLGGLTGGATMLVEAEFVTPGGDTIGRVRGQGNVSGGIAGGSHNSAIDSAVKQIRDYAVATFRR